METRMLDRAPPHPLPAVHRRPASLRWWLLAALLALPGCGDTQGLLPDWLAARAEAEAAPAGPSLRIAQGGRSATAILVHEQGERRIWRTRTGVVVATDGPRVVGTAGLPTWLVATRFDAPDPMADPLALRGAPADSRRVLDFSRADRDPATMRFGVALECRTVAIPEVEDGLTLMVQENCRGEGVSRVVNRFRVDATSGVALDSEQWVGPGMAPLRLVYPVR
jgi:hypothetical protein